MTTSHYVWEKIVAAGIVLVLAAVAALVPPLFAGWREDRNEEKEKSGTTTKRKKRAGIKRRRWQRTASQPPFAALLGADGRLSTSKTVAGLWTLIVAYVLVALILIWPSDWSSALAHLWPTYVLFLGGPYAALVLAKAGVSARVNSQSLQKPQGSGDVRLSDLLGDDTGRPDLFDSQYVLFNLIAMIFVVDGFIRFKSGSSGGGFPSIPEGLVLLTGGPAAVYTANKLSSSNAPIIFSVRPSVVRPGDTFTIYGQNLAPAGTTGGAGTDSGAASANGAGSPATPATGAGSAGAPGGSAATGGGTLEVGGQTAQASAWTDTTITATAPTPNAPTATALDVGLTTSAGVQAVLAAALTINQAPSLDGLSAARASGGASVTASGQWALAAGAAPTVRVDGLAAAVAEQPIPGSSVTFTVPTPAAALPTSVSVRVLVAGLASNPATLEITG